MKKRALANLVLHLVLLNSVTVNVFSSALAAQAPDQLHKRIHSFSAMGVEFRVVAYVQASVDFDSISKEIEARVEYLESVFSDYRKDSEVNRLAESAPHLQPVEVSKELFRVCRLAENFHEASGGAFDPTVGRLSQLWRLARKRNRMPRLSSIDSSLESVGWKYVELKQSQTIRLARPSMRLDFGGIAKGFAADEVIKLLREHSIANVLVDAGGDISISGCPVGQTGWKVAVESSPGKSAMTLNMRDAGVATSGSTKQRLLSDGKKYSHIIDPRNGQPVTHCINVTVIAKNAADADAWASTFSVLGVEESLRLANADESLFAMFFDVDDGRTVQSTGFENFTRQK